ncbi:pectate lyase, partial [bacterium]|nr:pectate lyase [bacterium]
MMQTTTAQAFPLQVKDGKINYTADNRGNRILDFSYCGYQSSEKEIPALPNVIFVPKQDGDASDIIQRAINYVAELKPDANGFRGAVLLDKGTFILEKSLWIKKLGIVLRGTDKNETILQKNGFDR